MLKLRNGLISQQHSIHYRRLTTTSAFRTMAQQDDQSSVRSKKLVLCCDGTWLDSDNSYKPPSIIPWNPTGSVTPPSNVTRLSQALKATDAMGRPQIAYYQAGLGTGWTLENRILGGALGLGLAQNVREAYNFLAGNYETGDEIYLLGFSRGAFTARSVGGFMTSLGLLNKVGLRYLGVIFEDWLHSADHEQEVIAQTSEENGGIPGFRVNRKPGDKDFLDDYVAELQRLKLTRKVDINAIGVFETVGALGIPSVPLVQHLGLSTVLGKLKFWNTALHPNVKHAFQALALDERRASYVPSVWNKTSDNTTTNLKQVWFPGVHSNVGGSYPGNGIGILTLAWMMSQLSPFLTFEEHYITKVYQDNQRYLASQKQPTTAEQKYGGWGEGLIPNSARFPRSLLGVKTRTPDAYHEIDRATGKILEDRPLLNTAERVHACVRARIEEHGTKVGSAQSGYFPQALDGWEIKDPLAAYGKAEWKNKKDIDHMPEDELGVVELELLELFKSGHEPESGS